MGRRFLAVFGLLAGGALLLNRWVPNPLSWQENGGEIAYALALSALASYFVATRLEDLAGQRLRKTIQYAAAWLGIFLVLAVGHAYRFELGNVWNRVAGDVMPGRGVSEAPGEMRFRAAPDGHFYITAEVNGRDVRFLADTGATDIVLSPSAARRVGYDPDELRFDRMYQTANGLGRGASVRLQRLSLGDLVLQNVPASVNEAGMDHSLLGMGFFNRLDGYTVRDGVLTLYW
jgi:aspartyl protease family protein